MAIVALRNQQSRAFRNLLLRRAFEFSVSTQLKLESFLVLLCFSLLAKFFKNFRYNFAYHF